jgi:hypothetical protein
MEALHKLKISAAKHHLLRQKIILTFFLENFKAALIKLNQIILINN